MMLICLLNLQNLSLTGPMYNVLPPIIMVLWRVGPYKTTCSFLYNRVIFHFHDYGRKGNGFGFLYRKISAKCFSKDCNPKPLDPRTQAKPKYFRVATTHFVCSELLDLRPNNRLHFHFLVLLELLFAACAST